MALPEFSMRQLLEAGAHFGHQTHRWNPKMERYIFGSRSNIHIIDLSQTIPLLHQALVKVRVRIDDVLFVDYLSYHLIGGAWLVTAKSFHIEHRFEATST